MVLVLLPAVAQKPAAQPAPRPAGVATPPNKQPSGKPAPFAKGQYGAPGRESPGRLASAGVRALNDARQCLFDVLAPAASVGQTSLTQPELYWYTDCDLPRAVEITVVSDEEELPVMALTLPNATSGLQRLAFADHKVFLKPGVGYYWFVSVVVDRTDRSKDAVRGAAIVMGGSPAAGFWYDDLAHTFQSTADAGKLKELGRKRQSMLNDVGLAEIAGKI